MNDQLLRLVWLWIYGDKDGNRTEVDDLAASLEAAGFPEPDDLEVPE